MDYGGPFEGYVVGFGTTDELRTEDNYLPLEVRDPFRQDKMANECCSIQLIDGDGVFNVTSLEHFMKSVKLAEHGFSYAVVSIMGPQSSGKRYHFQDAERSGSATNRLITAKDHASVQINIGHLDDNGVYTGQYTTFALSGFIRAQVSFCERRRKEKLGGRRNQKRLQFRRCTGCLEDAQVEKTCSNKT
ncbi:hypothetical protein ZIOFF_065699 [Zingiber officinale]|uniref:Uncharacterized protein n=1 Tax=Zingiber officinale TaxID=94328 RepID=A0A8J5F0H1_ZINOF|nr:hypothetical protein ZIOFF_065699 [Zingiber officinale]